MNQKDTSWLRIFEKYKIHNHNFQKHPFALTAEKIKEATKGCKITEPRILCKQDIREKRPQIFIDNNLFILPTKNDKKNKRYEYVILKGEGYVDIPEIDKEEQLYKSQLDFELETAKIGNSEMQHLDFAYASSLIRTFLKDDSLVLTIRGRKYTQRFEFLAGEYKQSITVESVQTEVDAGYEGKNQIVLIEAKNQSTKNVIIRQLYYSISPMGNRDKEKEKSLCTFL